MKKRVFLLFLIPFLILANGCVPTPTSYYQGTWVVGEHVLHYTERFQDTRGTLGGGLFFIQGSMTTEPALTFAWEPREGEVVLTSLPLSKFRFVIDEEMVIPTVEFSFYDQWADELSDPNPQQVNEANPNDFLMGNVYFGGLKYVVVRISTPTLEKEIYLPK